MSNLTAQFIRLRPGSLQSHYNLAVVLEGMGRLEAAEYNYRRAGRLTRNHAMLRSRCRNSSARGMQTRRSMFPDGF